MYPFDKYLLCTHCMPDMHLGSKDTTVNKQGPYCHRIHILVGIIKKRKNTYTHVYIEDENYSGKKQCKNI